MNEPERQAPKRDFLQRHATAIGITLVLGWGFIIAGVIGLIAAAVALLTLALVLAFVVTCIQAVKPFDPTSGVSTSGFRITGPMPFHRRFVRNIHCALTDLPLFWG